MKTHPALAGALRAAALALLLGAGLSSLPTAHAQATAHPPERMTYQGFLVDGNGAALGNSAPKNYDVIFRIWSSENGSSAAERLWTEQQTVTVDKGEVTLNGTVTGRDAKRRAEDIVEDLSGVKHVQNNLRVQAASGAAYTGNWATSQTSTAEGGTLGQSSTDTTRQATKV